MLGSKKNANERSSYVLTSGIWGIINANFPAYYSYVSIMIFNTDEDVIKM